MPAASQALPSSPGGAGQGEGAVAPIPRLDQASPIPFPPAGGETSTFWHQCHGHIWGKA
jgi:hypothetical protein